MCTFYASTTGVLPPSDALKSAIVASNAGFGLAWYVCENAYSYRSLASDSDLSLWSLLNRIEADHLPYLLHFRRVVTLPVTLDAIQPFLTDAGFYAQAGLFVGLLFAARNGESQPLRMLRRGALDPHTLRSFAGKVDWAFLSSEGVVASESTTFSLGLYTGRSRTA